MTYKDTIKELMETSITRKQFLGYIGVFIMSVIGVNDFISRLQLPQKQVAQQKTGRRFGNGRFGV